MLEPVMYPAIYVTICTVINALRVRLDWDGIMMLWVRRRESDHLWSWSRDSIAI